VTAREARRVARGVQAALSLVEAGLGDGGPADAHMAEVRRASEWSRAGGLVLLARRCREAERLLRLAAEGLDEECMAAGDLDHPVLRAHASIARRAFKFLGSTPTRSSGTD
jgi:hypothetical protein